MKNQGSVQNTGMCKEFLDKTATPKSDKQNQSFLNSKGNTHKVRRQPIQ
jgi:hypothetical protein